MNKELIKELALECIRNDKNEALKIVLGMNVEFEDKVEIKAEETPKIDTEVIREPKKRFIRKNKVKSAEVKTYTEPTHPAETIKSRGRQLGVRCGGKLAKYYDENELKLDIFTYDPNVLNKKDTMALLYLYDKYHNIYEVARHSGLKVSSVEKYTYRLRAMGLITLQGNNGFVTPNSLLYLNR